jgi:hypothetical protein
MSDYRSKEERISHRAYRIWQSEGCPQGRDKDHWVQAEKDIEREDEMAKGNENGHESPIAPPLAP